MKMIKQNTLLIISIFILLVPAVAYSLDPNTIDSTPAKVIQESHDVSKINILFVNQLDFSVDSSPVEQLFFGDNKKGHSYGSKEQVPDSLKTSSVKLDLPPLVDTTLQFGAALVANFALHEVGHKVLGDYVGATGTSLNFFKKKDGKFFIGVSSIDHIDDESMLPYSLAGEVAADLTFEQALIDYRKQPTVYNKSLMLLSGADFLRYCVYAFYLSDGHPHYDPISIANESGISRDTILGIALAKALLNAYRVYSGNDFVVPYFAVNRNAAMLNFLISF